MDSPRPSPITLNTWRATEYARYLRLQASSAAAYGLDREFMTGLTEYMGERLAGLPITARLRVLLYLWKIARHFASGGGPTTGLQD